MHPAVQLYGIPSNSSLYNIACTLSVAARLDSQPTYITKICPGMIGTAGGSFDQASVQSVDKALDNASMWLRQSVASGYASHLHMSQDPDLAMLRERRNVEYQWCYQTCQTNANTP